MELVEQHRADAGKLGIVKDHAGEDALGDDLDTCLRPGFRDHPRPQSDPLSDSLRQGVRHALRGSPRGNAARFQHQDLAGPEPAFVHQREGHACRLAGAGRGHEDGRCARGQGVAQFVQDGVDWKRCGKLHGGCIQRSRPYRKHDLAPVIEHTASRAGGRGICIRLVSTVSLRAHRQKAVMRLLYLIDA